MKRLLWLAMFLFIPVPVWGQEKIDDKVRVENDITFGKGGGTALKLDLAMPRDGTGPFPAVVCVHGGAWMSGNFKQMDQTIKGIAASGFVAITIQYRLTPTGAQFPAQIEDCKCAVRWLRANATKYHVDPLRIGAVGFSAGAHLVCLLGLTTKEDGLEGAGDLTKEATAQSSRVKAVVSFFGPTDFTKGDWDPKMQPVLTSLFGGTLEEKREAYKRASPITYVRRDTDNPCLLCFHGTKDNVVGYNQSVLIVDALKKVGGNARLVTMEGDGHGWRGDKMLKSIEETLEFFGRELKK